MSNTPQSSADPLLSIVVLVYNTEKYLPACFDSLLNQAYSNIEVIAIDDSSTDGSLAICEAYQAKDSRFRYVAKRNEGGAVSGNLGISLAVGEYVAIVDSDDVVTVEGYRALMQEAFITSADIVVGRAARLIDDAVSTVSLVHEPLAWVRRQAISSVNEFPELIHDGFYWNKVFKREFLIANGLGMVPGLLYADRPFVHRAYYLSVKTAVITDLVYLWRSREEGSQASITQNKALTFNFIDRVRSMEIEWREFERVPDADWYRRAIAVTNLQRALHLIVSIVASPAFRLVYVAEMQRILRIYGDIDYRALGARRSMYLELIKRNEIAGLCFLIGLRTEAWVKEIDGACYWDQPFLYNSELGIPRDAARLFFPNLGCFHLKNFHLSNVELTFELVLHDSIMANCVVGFALQEVEGVESVAIEALGRTAKNTYAYRTLVDRSRFASRGPYGMMLIYRHLDIVGQYRVGKMLLSAEAFADLPKHKESCSLHFSSVSGGLVFEFEART